MTSPDPLRPPQPLDYHTLPRPKWPRWLLVVLLLLPPLVVAALWAVPRLKPKREYPSSLTVCGSNLRQIGTAMLLYAAEPTHRGRFPDSFEELLLAQSIEAHTFICPLSRDTPALGTTKQQQAANLLTGGHCSYIYLAKGLTNRATGDIPLACERICTHGPLHRNGMNILFGDGHVQWFSADQATAILARAATRPTTAEVSRP